MANVKMRTAFVSDLPTGNYDFIAKLVGPREPHKNIPANTNWTTTLQKEIMKQFGITGRLEMRAADVLVLKPSKTGIRGFKLSHEMPNGQAMKPIFEPSGNSSRAGYEYHEQPVSTLISLLEQRFQIPIIDKSGLTQEYDYSVTWLMPHPVAGNNGALQLPDLEIVKQSLINQLGLELVPSREPVEMLVVERVK